MNNKCFHRCLFAFSGCCLILLLAACGSGGGKPVTTPTTTGNSPTPGNGTVTPPATATALPPTQTSCPAAGTARAAVMPPVTLGTHQNIVYSVDEYRGNEGGVKRPSFGTLKRYDVATGQKTEIVKMPGVEISDAQVSADGQWLLFAATDGKQAKLQLIRMDGKELQTLYCTQPSGSFIGDVQWSFDQKRVVFRSQVNDMDTLYLLNVQDGSLQTELSGTRLPSVLTWLDNTRLYLENPGIDAPPTDLYLLDTGSGAPQSVANLEPVFQTGATVFCWDAASSIDGTHLFISQCTSDIERGSSPSAYPSHGPSTITIRPATGGSPQTIFASSSLGIRAVRVINQTSLLLLVKSRGPHVDTSQNGLWMVNMSGMGLTSLSRDSAGLDSSLNHNNQYPWSNVSRDGSLYSMQSELFTPPGTLTYTLLAGSLQGGSPTVFASISDGTRLDLVGWTTM